MRRFHPPRPRFRSIRLKMPVGKDQPGYAQLWRVVDGAVYTALHHHPEYLAPDVPEQRVRESINKRVVGQLRALLCE